MYSAELRKIIFEEVYFMDKALSFTDVLKKSFLNLDAFQKISFIDVAICMLVALAVALFIFFIYKYTFRGVVYSYTYNMSLVLMCVLTALIILTISSNVVISLGMVGALSIIRFRTALKDPMDIVFMFWAIVAGLSTGAGIYSVSILGSIFAGAILIVMSKHRIRVKKYMLIIHYSDEAMDEVNYILGRIKHILKSKTIIKGVIEINVEVNIKGENTSFVNQLSQIQGVADASLVSYNGDYAE
jgi:hypothetical protein